MDAASNVVPFRGAAPPDLPADLPPWLRADVQRELHQIAEWLAAAQASLARLPGAERRHHLALRRLADELRRDAVQAWGVEA